LSVEGRPPDEAALLRKARGGDLDAYAQLLRVHEAAARNLARALCGPEGDDATQEAFVKSWSGLARYRSDAPFRSWLLRIVANESRNRLRSAGRRSFHELRLAEDRTSGGAAPSPEAAVLEHERRTLLLAALNGLPERLREVVVCRHLLGLSEAETVAVLDIAPGTAKSRLKRALDRLRAELTPSLNRVREPDA
jgi:RNA polymerase sigma factor (sigma-70 family)